MEQVSSLRWNDCPVCGGTGVQFAWNTQLRGALGMGASKLKAPGADFATTPLDIVMVSPALLFRVSGHDTGEPYFGRSGANRFDDPSKVVAKRYGTCYMGLSLKVAFAESVLHDLEPTKGSFSLPAIEITRRFALTFKGPELRLANLTGSSLLVLNGNAELSGTSDYKVTQKWGRAVASHPANVDGFLYMSRRISDGLAVVLFQRHGSPAPDVTKDLSWQLDDHPLYMDTVKELRVKPQP